ncbi:MAG TPA: tripartite tricarboxylate transporter substrate-binding protein [Quisquiliibacterium sp.]|nr:tripartite tricarboxylate transporter substrate-binding protein [Quisquiliibacterium sp.]
MKRRTLIRTLPVVLAAAALGPLAATASAQDAPLKILVGFPAGGSIDTIARSLAAELTTLLKRPVVVENRPGAGGQIAAVALKGAAPDGNTLFLTNSHTVSMIPLTVRTPGFEPAKDFAPVSMVAMSPDVLGVNVKLVGEKGGLREFIEWAKANPGKASVGVPAPASAPDFAVKMMGKAFRTDLNAVSYRGDGPVVRHPALGRPCGHEHHRRRGPPGRAVVERPQLRRRADLDRPGPDGHDHHQRAGHHHHDHAPADHASDDHDHDHHAGLPAPRQHLLRG